MKVPAGHETEQVPSFPGRLQALQEQVFAPQLWQGTLQQTPSTQYPDPHWPGEEQG